MTNVTLYQPFEALARRFFDDFEAAPETARGGFFRADIEEDEKSYLIRAEMPGVKKEDVAVSLEDGVLSVAGKFAREEKSESAKVLRAERLAGSFSRSFRLPTDVEADKIDADLIEGVLTVRIPKHPGAAKRAIKIG